MASLVGQRKSLGLDTRKGKAIKNEIYHGVLWVGTIAKAASYIKEFPEAVHRPTKPTDKYNCHGLTFGSRRTRITEDGEIEKILQEDGYIKLPDFREVLAGDVAIYVNVTNENDVEHSGIVVEVRKGPGLLVPDIWILSKWGSAHEAIHRPRYCPFKGAISYYRLEE